MKIAVDCADLDSKRIDGTRVYIKNVLNQLGTLTQEDEFFLYHRKKFNPNLQPRKFSNYQEKIIPYPFFWTQTRLAFELLKEKPAVCWMPIQQIPFLIAGKIKTVFTAHDLAFKFFPDCFEKKDFWKLNFFIDSAIKKADGIIAISQTTKKDLLKIYPFLNEEKIKVIYHGFDAEEFQEKNSKNEEAVLQKNDLLVENKVIPFILYVGAIQPRKNLETLIGAFEKLKQKEKNNLKLVLVGASAWLAEKVLQRVRSSVFAEDIILTGGVSFADLNVFYRKAEMLVFPSLYEGFGLPILEAWASNLPVIVGDNSSLKEIGGLAVEKFSTFSSEELVVKIELLLKNRNRREELIALGKEELKKYSWRKCAQETLDFLKEIVKK